MFVAGLAMATLLLSAAGRYPRLLPRARRGSLNRRRFLGLLPEPLTPEPRRFARWVNATSRPARILRPLCKGAKCTTLDTSKETLPAASVGYQLSEGHAFGSRYG